MTTKKGLIFYRHGSRQRDRHGCPPIHIKADRLDTEVWGRLAARLNRPDVIRAEVARMRQAEPAAAELTVIDRQLETVSRKQGNLVKRLAQIDDEDTAAIVTAEVNALAAQRRQLQAERTDVEDRRAGWRAGLDQLAGLEEWCRRVAINIETLGYDRKRQLLDALAINVRLYHSDHDPRYEVNASLPLEPDGEDGGFVSITPIACAASAC